VVSHEGSEEVSREWEEKRGNVNKEKGHVNNGKASRETRRQERRDEDRRDVWYSRSLETNPLLNVAWATRADDERGPGPSLEPGTLTGRRLTCLEDIVDGAMLIEDAAIAERELLLLLLLVLLLCNFLDSVSTIPNC